MALGRILASNYKEAGFLSWYNFLMAEIIDLDKERLRRNPPSFTICGTLAIDRTNNAWWRAPYTPEQKIAAKRFNKMFGKLFDECTSGPKDV